MVVWKELLSKFVMLIARSWKGCIIFVYLWKTKSTRLMYLRNFYKNMGETYVLLMETSNMHMAKFDVFCILKMKLMKMMMMEACLFCKGLNIP